MFFPEKIIYFGDEQPVNEKVGETIAAVCTAPGGALSIVRISGPRAGEILERVWIGRTKPVADPRRLILGRMRPENGENNGEPCLAVLMTGPHSYTGEDIAEIQCHGGACAPARVLRAVLCAGARHAEPGEFTRRAFLNGKLDLTQAEAVADLIHAQTTRALHLAETQLSGTLGQRIRALREPLTQILAETESHLDFPEEELDWRTPDEMCRAVRVIDSELEDLIRTSVRGSLIRNGVRLVIAGEPNAGKSSLLNRFLGYDRAIVSDIPGTTRDTLEESVTLGGVLFRVTDTAGLRPDTADPLESLGMLRSRNSLSGAQLVLALLDATRPDSAEAALLSIRAGLAPSARLLICWNKSDLLESGTSLSYPDSPRISAVSGAGIDTLIERMTALVWLGEAPDESDLAVSERHRRCLEEARAVLAPACAELLAGRGELASSLMRDAIHALGRITGESADPDILDEIFSRFCIGK